MVGRGRLRFRERFTDVWVLLSDTDRFISRSGLLSKYERQLREWRLELQQSQNSADCVRRIREALIAFRQARRSEGWELRLGSLDIRVKGFRSDDSMAQGFRRMVLMVGEGGEIHFITGHANHIELDEELGVQLRRMPSRSPLQPHYLWYRRMEGVIELAGADSQLQESQQQLKEYVGNHKSELVRAMHKIR